MKRLADKRELFTPCDKNSHGRCAGEFTTWDYDFGGYRCLICNCACHNR